MASLGPLVAYLPTPRSTSGALQTSLLQEFAHAALSAGANSLAVLGSAGAAAYMPRSMRKRVIAAVAEVTLERVPLVAGVSALTTAEVQLNLSEARSAGATVGLLAPMSYEPLTNFEVTGLFREMSASQILPLCVYNNPRTTRFRFTPELLGALAHMPGVMGFKDTAASPTLIAPRLQAIQAGLTDRAIARLDWGFSGDRNGAQILTSGATTWHSGLAGVLPQPFATVANLAGQTQDPQAQEAAHSLSQAITPLAVIGANYGTVRVAHAVAQLTGHPVGPLPLPLHSVPGEVMDLISVALSGIHSATAAQLAQPQGRRAQRYAPRRAASTNQPESD